MDRGLTEVDIAKEGGASAATVLGQAPIETINAFIEKCQDMGLDSMVDMMNVEYPSGVLSRLTKLPDVVILHRGVDEENYNPEKEIPYYEIQRIKSQQDIMIAVAGGDTIQEVQTAIFNDVDIVILWRAFFKSNSETIQLVEEFLREIR
jgi:bifunctional enzyme Fae/Hps